MGERCFIPLRLLEEQEGISTGCGMSDLGRYVWRVVVACVVPIGCVIGLASGLSSVVILAYHRHVASPLTNPIVDPFRLSNYLPFILVGIAVVSFLVMYGLLQLDLYFPLEILLLGTFFITSLFLVWLYMQEVQYVVGFYATIYGSRFLRASLVSLVVGLVISGGITYSLSRRCEIDAIRNMAIVVLSSLVGAFLGLVIVTPLALGILVLVSIFDFLSIRYGSEIKIDEKISNVIPKLTYSFQRFDIGFGDLIFYALFSAHINLYFGILPLVSVSFGIIIGAIMTHGFLTRRYVVPGLPLSIGFGLVFLVFTFIL